MGDFQFYLNNIPTQLSTMEPDWSNIDAVRSWLDSRYPNSNNQTGSPLYRYLKDELAGTQELYRLEGRETHLSVGDGGKFLKFLFENAGDNTVYYRTMRETIYALKHYPEYKVPPTPDTDEDDSPKLESSEKRGRAEKAQLKRKRSSTHSASAVNKAKIRRRNSPTKDTTTDGELARIQDERRSTLRLRRNGEVHKVV